MSERFDPYHEWLGIGPQERPLNCYRLLGIPLFETNANVIANAADRQMAHVRSFQNGPRAAESQRLLNELAQSRVLLLTPAKKAAYDEQIRQQLQEQHQRRRTEAKESSYSNIAAIVQESGGRSSAARKPAGAGLPSASSSRSRTAILIGSGFGLVFSAILLIAFWPKSNTADPVTPPEARPPVEVDPFAPAIAQLKKLGAKFDPPSPTKDRPLRISFNLNRDIRDDHLKLLAALPELEELDLGFTEITDAGLEHLKSLKKLRTVSMVTMINITPQGVAGLAKARPGLNIVGVVVPVEPQTLPVEDAAIAVIDRLGGKYFDVANKPGKPIVSVDLANKKLNPADLAPILALPHLEKLNLTSTHPVGGSLYELTSLKAATQLKSLTLNHTGSIFRRFEELADCPRLEGLSARGEQVGDAGLSALTKLKKLRRLNLSSSPALTDAGLAAVSQATWLTRLEIADCNNVSDTGLLHLAKMTNLTDLVLQENESATRKRFTQSGVDALRKALPNCRIQGLGRPALPPEQLAALNLKDLQRRGAIVEKEGVNGPVLKIDVSGIEGAASVLSDLAFFPKLKSLGLGETAVSDEDLARIVKLTDLQSLNLSGSKITDAGAAQLATLVDLQHLNVRDTNLTDAGLSALKGRLTALESLDLGGTQVTESGLAALSSFPKLRSVGLANLKLTKKGLAELEKLRTIKALDLSKFDYQPESLTSLWNMFRLDELNLAGLKNDSRKTALFGLDKLSNLKSLGLADTTIDDARLSTLVKKMITLRALDLTGTAVTEAAVASIITLPQLTDLRIGRTKIPAVALARLRALKNLEVLHLDGLSPLTDTDLAQLKGLSKLKDLNVCGTQITSDGIQALRTALPALVVVDAKGERVTPGGADEGWKTIFDGTVPAGQRLPKGWLANRNEQAWSVIDGRLVADVGPGGASTASFLVYQEEFVDFELEATLRLSAGADSGIVFRQPMPNATASQSGYQAQLCSRAAPATTVYRTGSLHTIQKCPEPEIVDEEWFDLSVKAQGDQIQIKVNGVPTVDVRDAKFKRGYISIEAWNRRVEFKSIRVRPLSEPGT